MNNSAQIHVLEVIIVAGMLLMSLFFVRTFEFTPNIKTSEENELEVLGNSILSNLESVPDNLGQYSSLLARYISKNETGKLQYIYEFTDYINESIPSGAIYEISLVNISDLSVHPEKSMTLVTITLIQATVKIGKEAHCSRIIVIYGSIYEVVLTIFFTLR